MTCTGRWKQNVPTVSASRVISSYLVGYIIYFLMYIWELGRKFSEDEVLQQFLVGWHGKNQSCFQFERQPRKRQPCTEVPLCLTTGDPQMDSSKQSRFVLMPLLFSYKATIPQIKKCLKFGHLNCLIMFFSLKKWSK